MNETTHHVFTTVRNLLGVTGWGLLIAMLYAFVISCLDPAIPWPLQFAWVPWHVAALNVVPALLFTLLLIALTRRAVLAIWLTVLTLGGLYAINTHKMEQLATPLLPDDFKLLPALGIDFSLFEHYVTASRSEFLIGGGIILTTVLLCRGPVLTWLRGWRRAALGLVALTLCGTLAQGAAPWSGWYDPGRLRFEPWAPVESAMRTGLLTNMIHFYWELRSPKIPLPDLSAAGELLREIKDLVPVRAAPSSMLPDIVILQSESLFDPGRLTGALQANYLPNYHRLRERGWSGALKVPTYGGGTIRTEFEVLTGLPLEAFPNVRYPYLELTRRQMPGLVRVLRQHGYLTTAIHPNSGAFWNRNQAFRSMGFDHFVDGRDFPAEMRRGWFVSDKALTDRVLTELADAGPPQFVLAISIQNHGPYQQRPGIDPGRLAAAHLPPGLSAKGRQELVTYIALLEETDEELGRLADALMRRKRPTLLLFYGDHLPSLNETFSQIGFASGEKPQDQPVPWLLLDNRTGEPRTEDISAWLLPSLLLSAADIDGGRYFDLLEALRYRWKLDGLGNDERNSGLAAITQLEYDGTLATFLDAADAML